MLLSKCLFSFIQTDIVKNIKIRHDYNQAASKHFILGVERPGTIYSALRWLVLTRFRAPCVTYSFGFWYYECANCNLIAIQKENLEKAVHRLGAWEYFFILPHFSLMACVSVLKSRVSCSIYDAQSLTKEPFLLPPCAIIGNSNQAMSLTHSYFPCTW